MNTTNSDVLLTRKEAAVMLRVCVALLDRLHLPSVRFGRRVFYRRETLAAYIAANEQAHAGRVI